MVNWPPVPVKPISEPNRIDFLSYSIFQLISFRATRAGGIMVSDQTTYPRVGGKPAFSVISINAPQTPQNRVVISANTSQIFDFISGRRSEERRVGKECRDSRAREKDCASAV